MSTVDTPDQAGLVAQILGQAPSQQVAEAMLFGAASESGQDPEKGAGTAADPAESGGVEGAFQFTPPSAWGLTASTALDPMDEVGAILSAYTKAAAAVPAGLAPGPAAEWTAIAAEKPAGDTTEMQQIQTTGTYSEYGAASSEVPASNYALAVTEDESGGAATTASASGAAAAATPAGGTPPSTGGGGVVGDVLGLLGLSSGGTDIAKVGLWLVLALGAVGLAVIGVKQMTSSSQTIQGAEHDAGDVGKLAGTAALA